MSNETLLEAVSSNQLESVRILVEKGTDVNQPTINEGCPAWMTSSNFPLYEACHKGFFDIAKYLIERGADVNQKNDEGGSPLLTAVGGGYNGEDKRDIVFLLLENGADINVESEYGETPLLRALDRADYEVLHELLNRGVKIPDLKNSNNLLHYFVARRANREVDGIVVLNKEENSKRNEKIIKFLFERGYGINSQNDDGETPLSIIADSDDDAMVKLLLECGSDPNIANQSGITPLQKACLANKFNIVWLLVSHGAKLNSSDKFSKTPFQCTENWKIKLYLLFKRYFY